MDYLDISKVLKNIVAESRNMIPLHGKGYDEIEVKSRNSLVTEIDKKLEHFYVSELQNLIPEAGFIAEEGTSNKKGVDFNWIIDPLDGTTNFIHGIPAFCCSIALMEGKEIVLGGIMEFNSGEYFEAVRKEGAFLNGNKIEVSKTQELSNSLLATGFPYYDFKYTQQYLNLFSDFMKETRGLRRIGSAALDMAYVACGRFDGFFEYSLHPWDVAAGIIIIEEAGGKISDFKGGQNHLFGKQLVASNGLIYNHMMKYVKNHFKS